VNRDRFVIRNLMESKSQIRKLAKLLMSFKSHLTIFIIGNMLLWAIWLLNNSFDFNSLPLYISVTWSVILMIHYLVAYEIFKLKKNN
jgi:hypothetical protein